MRRVDNENVGPFDEFFENLLRARGFQIKSDAALVAIGEVPRVGILGDRLRREVVRNSPQVAVRRLNLDDVGAEIDRITAALGPAMKLARSTTFSPEKMLSFGMFVSLVLKFGRD
jgi:hypothetical protein